MEEVVAKKSVYAIIGYILTDLIGIGMIVMGAVFSKEEVGALYIGIAVGGIILATGVSLTVRYFMVPVKAVVYKDGVLYFPGKVSCKPEELERVFIKLFKSRYGAVSSYGKLEVTIHGNVHKYNDIAQIKDVQERLLQLNKEAVARLSMPVQQPENTSTRTDPFGGTNSDK